MHQTQPNQPHSGGIQGLPQNQRPAVQNEEFSRGILLTRAQDFARRVQATLTVIETQLGALLIS